MFHIKKILCSVLAVVCLICAFPVSARAEGENQWPTEPQVASESAIVMETSTGAILYEKNIHEKRYPASITKIMTTLLALEHSSMSDVVTFSYDSVHKIEGTHIGIKEGEQLTMEQCLYGIMLGSANEVSYAVAEHVGGDLNSFVQMMNDRAAELGCQDTHFNNPHGLPDENHYTSAYDMALISCEAIKNSTFRTITGTYMYTIPATNITQETRPITNHHKIIKKAYKFDGCIGGKTGYTNAARNTLVTFAKRGDMELVCVVMKAEEQNHYTDTITLLDYVFNNFQLYNISDNEKNFSLDNKNFFHTDSSLFGSVSSKVKINSNGCIVLPKNAEFNDASSTISFADLDENTVANLSYTYFDHFVGKTTIELADSVDQTSSMGILKQKTNITTDSSSKKLITINLRWFIIIGGILLAFFLLSLFNKGLIRHKKNKKLRKRRKYYNKY